MSQPGLTYTPEIDDQIRVMWASGKYRTADIAKELGLGRNQIIGRINRQRKLEGEERWRRDRRIAGVVEPKKKRFRKPKLVVNKAKNIREVSLASMATHSSLKCDPVSFVNRELSRCAFPLDDNIGPEMQVCGAKTEVGYSWCSHHRRIVFPGNFKASGKGFRLSKIGAAA